MQLQLSEQEQLVTEDVTFPLEHPEPSLFPVQTSAWIRTMLCILLHIQTVIII